MGLSDFALKIVQLFHRQYCDEVEYRVVEIRLDGEAKQLDRYDVVHHSRHVYIIYSADIILVTPYHQHDLPASISIFGYSSEQRSFTSGSRVHLLHCLVQSNRCLIYSNITNLTQSLLELLNHVRYCVSRVLK